MRAEAIASKNYDLASIYAGEAAGLVTRQQSAGGVIQYLGDGAERLCLKALKHHFER